MKKIFSLVVASLVAGSAFADDLAEGVYYIKSASSDVYLTRGQLWGTQAVVEPYGHPWKVTLSEGKYKLQMYDIFTSGETVKSLGTEGYVDQSGNKVVGLDIAAGATEGSYSIAANGQFVSPNESNAIAYGATSYDWKFISSDEYKANQEAAIVAQEAVVAAEAGIDLTGTNLAAYVAENYVCKAITAGFAPVPVSGGTDWTFTVGRKDSQLKYGDYGIECFQGSGSLTQNLTGMTKGLYKVGIKAMQRSVSNAACFALGQEGYTNSGCYLNANGKTVNVKDWYSSCVDNGNPDNTTAELEIANKGGYYSEVFTYVGEDGKLDLTVNFPSYWGASWFIFNGIDIVYYLDKNSGTAPLIAEFDGWVAQADSLLALPMAEDVKTALETAKVAPTEDSVDAYTDAISALKNAVAAALVSTKKYDNVPEHDVTSLATDTWTNQGNRYQGRIERWNNSTYVGDVLTQTISGLVPGAVYELVIEASVCTTTERDNIAGAATGDGLTVVFANEGEVNAPCIAALATSNFPAYTVTGTVDKNGNLKFGIKNIQLGANWFTIRLISITTKGNPTVDAYQTAQAAIAPVNEALAAADAAIVDPNYTDIVATYRATLDGYVATTNSVIADVDSLFAEVALLPQVDSLVAALPTVESINTLVTEFKAAIAASQHIAVKKAKLLHTASVCWGSNGTQYNNVDGPSAHYNNDAASAWAGCAFAEFSFTGMNAKSIQKATLTWQTSTNAGKSRDNSVYYLTPGTELGYDTIPTTAPGAEYRFVDSRTLIGTVNNNKQGVFVGELDATEAIAAAVAAGKSNVIFMWTNNAGGGDIVGVGQENAPTLEIEFDMAPSLKKILIRDFEAERDTSWTANTAANCSIVVFNNTHMAGAIQNGSGNRGAYYDLATNAIKSVIGTEKTWAIEWDMALQSGNVANRSQSAFGLGTTASNYVANSIDLSNLLFAMETDQSAGGISDVWYITTATSTETVIPEELKLATLNLDPAKVYHFQLKYDNGNVTVKVSDEGTEVATVNYTTTYTLDDFRGFVTCVGRGSGYTYLDNIAAGTYTYDEIVEDPVFTPQGESYDTVFVAISTETEGATIKYTIDGGEEQTYEAPVELAQTATLAAWAEKKGSVSNVVSKKFIACVTPAPAITKAGQTYGADTVTITTEVPGAVIRYSIAEGDTLDYTDKFITDKTITVTAFAVYEGRPSEDVTLHVVAGEVKTPVVTLSSVDGASREIAFATETAAASIVYKLNDGAEVVGKQAKDTIAIDATTNIKVWARYVEGEKVFESAVVDTTFEAGAAVQLAGVEIATEDYSAVNQSADLKVSTSQLEVLLNPAVEIVWAYGETTGVAANGDVIKGVPVGATFTAYARAAGYVDSEKSSVEVAPSYASTIFSEDYEDGTIGSWTAHSGWMPVNTAAADGTHFLHFYQEKQGGDRWAQLEFPEYSSTSYTLSFKIGIAAGNGGASVFTAYAGADTLFQFNTPLDLAQTPGERITTVYNGAGEVVGTFGFYQPNRFEWADDKLASVDVTVSESGVVLTVVNNLGQTQVKTKISDAPVVITKLYEFFPRSFGSFRMDDVKIAGRAGSVMAPEFALDHYDVINPAVAILDATDKTDIYYRAASTTYTIDEEGKIIAGEYTFPEEYTKYEGPVVFTNEATIIEAYAMYEGVVASPKSISPVYLSLTDLAAPTVAFAGVGEGAVRNFNVKDNTSELIDAAIFYQSIGATEADTLKETTITTDSAAFGWFSVYAQVGELKSAVVNRYVDSRAVYNEPYVGFAGEGNTFPAAIADFEAGVGATIAGEYPTALIATTGTQYVHVAVTGKYAAFTLPFAFVVGTNVITNAQGDTLKLGEDYRILTLHTRNAQNTKTAADLATLVNAQNIESAVRAEGTNFSAGIAVMIEPLTEKVGNEVVLHSAEAAPIQVAATVTTVPTNGGYRLVANNRYENLALETPAYVLNEEGTKFVYTENPTLGALDAVIVIDPAKVADFGQEIDLVNASAIETLAVDAQVDNTYDLQGRKAQSRQKGQLYIQNGKRVMDR